MAGSMKHPMTLASVRIQETDQRPDEAAKVIVEFLERGPGHVVDTSESPDDTRVILAVGFVIEPPAAEGPDRGPAG